VSAPRTLSRTQLLGILLVISLVPPIFVVSMVATHEPPAEPLLEVQVQLTVELHAAKDQTKEPQLLPTLRLHNPTSDRWRNLSIGVNRQFYYYHPDFLAAGESIAIPLETFCTKGGSIMFQPGSETVKQVTVFAQLPSGARAVAEKNFGDDGREK
jgi:hypothetical protein